MWELTEQCSVWHHDLMCYLCFLLIYSRSKTNISHYLTLFYRLAIFNCRFAMNNWFSNVQCLQGPLFSIRIVYISLNMQNK